MILKKPPRNLRMKTSKIQKKKLKKFKNSKIQKSKCQKIDKLNNREINIFLFSFFIVRLIEKLCKHPSFTDF